MTNSDLVRSAFDAYLTGDRAAAEQLYASTFTFTSPQDDHIDRDAFFERCFPTAERLKSQQMRYVVDVSDEDVFVMYEYVLQTGERHRNTELLTVRDGQIVATQVFFGGQA